MKTSRSNPADKPDLYEKVTAEIIAALEAGTRPWTPTWTSSLTPPGLPLRITGEAYRGINVLLLWSVMMAGGYRSPIFMTYAQAQKLGGQVRKGEHGALVCYAGSGRKSDGHGSERRSDALSDMTTAEAAGTRNGGKLIHFLKSYVVFNVAQIDGLPERLGVEEISATAGMAEAMSAFITNTKARIIGGPNPLYRHGNDTIECPPVGDFKTQEDHAATILHELVHWTGTAARLNREMGKRYSDDAYGMEELVAEIGAAMLCASFGIGTQVREENAAYLATWLTRLRADKRAIFTAARLAQSAVDYLYKLQPNAVDQREGTSLENAAEPDDDGRGRRHVGYPRSTATRSLEAVS